MHASKEFKSIDDRCFLQTLLYTGCRISEALELTAMRIDVSNQRVIFRTLKQHGATRFRSVPIPENLLNGLLLMINSDGVGMEDTLWTFSRTTGWLRIKNCMQKAGIEGSMATSKGLRHAFGISCIQQKIDTFSVQKWLGHSKSETTGIYLEFVGEDELELIQRTWSGLV